MSLQKNTTRHGFSLVELLVVVTIISILASVVISSFSRAAAEARDAQRLANLRTLAEAAELYHAQTGCYPSDVANWDSSIGWGSGGQDGDGWHPDRGLRELELEGYISRLPDDPLNTT